MAKPKNITELRDQLLDAFDLVKRDQRRINQVREMTNTASKVLSTVKVQLEYSVIKKEEPNIPFVGKTSGIPLCKRSKRLR